MAVAGGLKSVITSSQRGGSNTSVGIRVRCKVRYIIKVRIRVWLRVEMRVKGRVRRMLACRIASRNSPGDVLTPVTHQKNECVKRWKWKYPWDPID